MKDIKPLLRKELLDLSFYKKSPFKGSVGALSYKIEKEEETFKVTLWPGPFCFEKTPDEKKETFSEEFSEEGLEKVTSKINGKAEAYNKEELTLPLS